MIIRKATHSDTAGIASVRVNTWRTAYENIVPPGHLKNLSYRTIEQQFDGLLSDENNIIHVIEDNVGNIAGFAFGGVIPAHGAAYKGEIYALYVLQEYERRGFGSRLVALTVDELLERGVNSMIIWVLQDNPYRRFYEKLSGTVVAHDVFTIDGTPLELHAYGWQDICDLSTQALRETLKKTDR